MPRSFGPLAAILALLPPLASCGGGEADHLVVEPTTLAFGAVLHGEVVSRHITLRNHGRQDVYVTSVQGNCACIAVKQFDRVVRPGEERAIEVQLVTTLVPPARLRGKRLDILSSDARVPRVEIPVEADIVRPFSVIPSQLDFGSRPAGAGYEEQTVKVRPGPGLRLHLLGWRASPPDSLEVRPDAREGGVDFRLRPAATPGRPGPFRAALVFRVRVTGETFESRELDSTVDVVGG